MHLHCTISLLLTPYEAADTSALSLDTALSNTGREHYLHIGAIWQVRLNYCARRLMNGSATSGGDAASS